MDDYRDAEPGKILHELRFGELAHFHRVAAHPLLRNRRCNTAVYLIVLHEAWKWIRRSLTAQGPPGRRDSLPRINRSLW